MISTSHDPCLYRSNNPKYKSVWILQYVDDLQISGDAMEFEEFLIDLKLKYKIRDYMEPRSFIGMEVTRTKDTLTLTQSEYIAQMAKRFNLTDAHYVSTPMDSDSLLTTVDDSLTKPDPTLYRAIRKRVYEVCIVSSIFYY